MPAAKDLQKKLDTLRDKIRHHEHRYYVLDSIRRSPTPNSIA